MLIEIKKVSKVYPSRPDVFALKNVSFGVKKGEVLGLLGVNGAGKTTLASIVATVHPPTGGDVEWEGESIYKRLLDYRKIVGLSPQKPNVEKSLTIEENLLFAGRCYGLSKDEVAEQAEALIDRFDLRPYAKLHSDQLSGGYRQRFLIARALMHKPQLVLLDEPTVGLDPHIRRQLWQVIRELRSSNISVILTTHYLDEAEELSDRVCLIHGGTIRTIDTPENLKRQHQKNNLEEVFLKFVDDPDAELFNAVDHE